MSSAVWLQASGFLALPSTRRYTLSAMHIHWMELAQATQAIRRKSHVERSWRRDMNQLRKEKEELEDRCGTTAGHS